MSLTSIISTKILHIGWYIILLYILYTRKLLITSVVQSTRSKCRYIFHVVLVSAPYFCRAHKSSGTTSYIWYNNWHYCIHTQTSDCHTHPLNLLWKACVYLLRFPDEVLPFVSFLLGHNIILCTFAIYNT